MTRRSKSASRPPFDVDRQIELLAQAKQHLEILFRQINLQRRCLQTVENGEDCFKSLHDCLEWKQTIDPHSTLPPQNHNLLLTSGNSFPSTVSSDKSDLSRQYTRFERNYRHLKKRCRKYSKLNTISSLYNILYSLFENCGEFQSENNRKLSRLRSKKSTQMTAENGEVSSKQQLKSDEYKLLLSLCKNPESLEKDGLLYFVCPLNNCRKTYKIKDNLLRHVETHSPENNEPDCSIKTESDGSLIKLISSPVKKQKRKRACGKKKKQNESESSEDGPIFHCEFDGCSYYSKHKSSIYLHKSKHRMDRPYQCEVCAKTFKSVYALRVHVLRHSNQRFECPFDGCNAIYSWYYTLKKHIRVHTNQAPIHRCDWPGCDYQSHRPDLLRKHRTRHTGERKFPCNWPDCGKAFKTESGLFDHLSMHKNERKHACTWPGCNYRCNLPGNLRKHIAIHEKKLAKSSNTTGSDPAQMLVPQQMMLIPDEENPLHF